MWTLTLAWYYFLYPNLSEHRYCLEDVCLIGGTSRYGNVYVKGKPVCDDDWNNDAANVVCKNLGYNRSQSFTIASK